MTDLKHMHNRSLQLLVLVLAAVLAVLRCEAALTQLAGGAAAATRSADCWTSGASGASTATASLRAALIPPATAAAGAAEAEEQSAVTNAIANANSRSLKAQNHIRSPLNGSVNALPIRFSCRFEIDDVDAVRGGAVVTGDTTIFFDTWRSVIRMAARVLTLACALLALLPAAASERQVPSLLSSDPREGSATESEQDELLTAAMTREILARKRDPLAPAVQVHMVWIGDISELPRGHAKYRGLGFNLTVHTDPDEILDGFQPFVARAYRLALPAVVGFDFLKLALLYKHGGLVVDADTAPGISASDLQDEYPRDCELIFGKESFLGEWEKPVFRKSGAATYGLARPFQVLNWAMVASKPRNPHVRWLLQTAMMHFFGMRDMELSVVQDISGSGLMTDYVALLHEKHGRSYREVFNDRSKHYPVEGLCVVQYPYFHGQWVSHAYLGSWRPSNVLWYVSVGVFVAFVVAAGGLAMKRSAWCRQCCAPSSAVSKGSFTRLPPESSQDESVEPGTTEVQGLLAGEAGAK